MSPDTSVTLALGCAGLEPKKLAVPFRNSPISPAVSTPTGPPPATMTLVALGRAAWKSSRAAVRAAAVVCCENWGAGVLVPVAMMRA